MTLDRDMGGYRVTGTAGTGPMRNRVAARAAVRPAACWLSTIRENEISWHPHLQP